MKYIESLKNQKKITENCVVAMRFLAVFDPATIHSFFVNVGAFLRNKDIFVFNYSVFNDEARRIGAKPGYELKENSGMYMLFCNGAHIQTFLTPNRINELLKKNSLVSVLSREEQILSLRGTDMIRGQEDPYSRKTEFVIKYNPN